MRSKPASIPFTIFVFILVLFSGGCRSNLPSTAAPGTVSTNPSVASSPRATAVQSATPVPTPTATPEPLAVRVNGEGISLAEYQAELSQLQAALKTLNKTLAPEQQRQQVLD